MGRVQERHALPRPNAQPMKAKAKEPTEGGETCKGNWEMNMSKVQ